MSLADEIEAGGGTDEAVALAFGWIVAEDFGFSLSDYEREWQPTPLQGRWKPARELRRFEPKPPAFLTDLNALAAEERRRGFTYVKVEHCAIGMPGEHASAEVGKMAPNDEDEIKGRGYCEGPNAGHRSRLAALIRAAESEARDG